MPDSEQLLTPPVQWAQRKSLVYISICLEDSKDAKIKLEPSKLYFRAKGGSDQREYEITINLFGEIIPDESKYVVRDRLIDFILKKKNEGPYWKRLVNEDRKFHWLKVDFNKWKDEDDSEDETGGNEDLEDMFKQMGGLTAGENSLGDLDAGLEEDSDDEGKRKLPDLEE